MPYSRCNFNESLQIRYELFLTSFSDFKQVLKYEVVSEHIDVYSTAKDKTQVLVEFNLKNKFCE